MNFFKTSIILPVLILICGCVHVPGNSSIKHSTDAPKIKEAAILYSYKLNPSNCADRKLIDTHVINDLETIDGSFFAGQYNQQLKERWVIDACGKKIETILTLDIHLDGYDRSYIAKFTDINGEQSETYTLSIKHTTVYM